MGAFDYDVVYQEILHADATSNLQFQTNDDEIEATNDYSKVGFVTCKAIFLIELQTEYLLYILIKKVIKGISSGEWSDCCQQDLIFKKPGHFLTVEKDMVYNGTRPFINNRLKRNVIELAHETHRGITATGDKIKLTSW